MLARRFQSTYLGALIRKRRGDLLREFRGRAVDRSAMRASSSPGSAGWLIARERRYAPRRDRGRGASSPVEAKARLLNSGGDKMCFTRNGYAETYARLLAPFVRTSPTVVELGVFMGTSLAVWCDLFPSGHVIGLDIELARFRRNEARLRSRGAFSELEPVLLEFDAFVPEVAGLVQALGDREIDVFIDDGPHEAEAQVAVARAVRPLLSRSALYVIEDCGGVVPPGLQDAFPSQTFQVSGGIVSIELGT